MQLRYDADGQERLVSLEKPEYSLGRSSENDVVLNDFSVSRKHARLRKEKDNWVLYDLGSTNGIKINDRLVPQTIVKPGDVVTIGTYVLAFRDEPVLRPPAKLPDSSATFLRSLADFNEEFNLEKPGATLLKSGVDSTVHRKRDLLDASYKNKIFEILVQVAKTLIVAERLSEVLEKVLDITFEYLPVERAFILLDEGSGKMVPALSRVKKGGRVEKEGELPISRTIIDTVVEQRVAILTSDALTDDRFDGGQSIRIHQIRSAMCVPLWSRDTIVGILHVDSPLHVGSFKAEDLDLLTALSNYAAVAIERTRLTERVESERKIRSRLERYHSPSVVEEIAASATNNETGRVEQIRVREVSIMFADVCGFTGMAESMEPHEVADLLGKIFQFAVDGIFAQAGTLDKFIGDAVMAFFGAPISYEDHALRAVKAAIHLRDQMREWNEARTAAGEKPIQVRIGINSGRALVGDIGPETRHDYTVLGNAVNIASRLEGHIAPPGEIVIAQPTFDMVKGKVRTDYMGDFPLKGLQAKIPVYRVDSAI